MGLNITSDWYECFIKYDKIQEDGTEKTVTEVYAVDAMSFTEAETSIVEHIGDLVHGDFQVKNINPATYHEIFFSDEAKDDKYWKVKVAYITTDEKTQKEKRTITNYLVQADKANTADEYVRNILGNSMIQFIITGVTETKILDVFRHTSK